MAEKSNLYIVAIVGVVAVVAIVILVVGMTPRLSISKEDSTGQSIRPISVADNPGWNLMQGMRASECGTIAGCQYYSSYSSSSPGTGCWCRFG